MEHLIIVLRSRIFGRQDVVEEVWVLGFPSLVYAALHGVAGCFFHGGEERNLSKWRKEVLHGLDQGEPLKHLNGGGEGVEA